MSLEKIKKVYKILQPRSENYIFKALSDEFDFLPSEDSEEEMPSKQNKSKMNIIKTTVIDTSSEDEINQITKKSFNKNAQKIKSIKNIKNKKILVGSVSSDSDMSISAFSDCESDSPEAETDCEI